jgi:hypothetical protein
MLKNYKRLFTLTICLGGVVTTVNNQVFRAVIVTSREVRVENSLGASGVSLLCVDRGTRHVGNHGIASAPGVLGVAEWVVLGRGLGEPDITTVSTEVAALEGISNILLDDDGATGSVDEP